MTLTMGGRGSGGAEGGCARGGGDDDVDGISGAEGGADGVGRQRRRNRMRHLQRAGSRTRVWRLKIVYLMNKNKIM